MPAPPPALAPPVPEAPPVPVVTLSTQTLFAQCCVARHACPQVPQSVSAVVVSRHAVPHGVSLAAQLDVHWFLLQTCPTEQAIVQTPQWFPSDARQLPLQSSNPVAH
jgi:hypothetical protein